MSDRADKAERDAWNVFLCHRQVDGRVTADWLDKQLQGRTVPTGSSSEPRINFYLDRKTAAVPNWRDVNQSALIKARAMIIVCSPGAAAVKGPDDEVQKEIRWWIERRTTAPILIDATGQGQTWVPKAVRDVWPDAQLVEVLVEAWEQASEEVRALNVERAVDRIIEGIRLSASDVADEQLAERRRSARKLRIALALTCVALLAALVGGVSAWVSERKADAARDTATHALDEVLRLADAKRVRDRVEEERRLWPVHPDTAEAMRAWIHAVTELETRREDHEAGIGRLRARSRTSDVGTRTLDPEDAWQLEVLEGVIAGLDRIYADGGLLEQVRARLDAVSNLEQESTGLHADEWRAAIARIAASETYAGLDLTAQLGLVPLGADPDSGLEEFAHVGSGSIPTRDHVNGRLAFQADAAIVLVLIPAGSFWMGAQRDDPQGRNHDPDADPFESPVHHVTLSEPFFLAKHECTQAQWKTMTGGSTPSYYMVGKEIDGRPITGRHPVEHANWPDAVGREGWLVRHRLTLPTEAQWEYACRGGNPDGKAGRWFFGNDLSQLGAFANIADAYSKTHGGPPHANYTEEVDDGHVVHAPVGSFRANPFGLHDVHGNVWELCLDQQRDYTAEPVTDPVGVREAVGSYASRGGEWFGTAEVAGSGHRYEVSAETRSEHAGLRPARAVER